MSADLPRADDVWRNGWGFGRTCVLAAAVEVNLFAGFADGPADAAELARRTRCSARGVTAMADALVGMGLLVRDDAGRYDVTEVTRTYLGPNPAVDLGPQVIHSKNLIGRWLELADVVRSGRPAPRDPVQAADKSFFQALVRQLFNGNYAAARVLASTLAGREGFRPRAVLDIGAGAATWSLPFAQADAACRVTALDYPAVLPVTQEYAQRFGVADRYEYLPGAAESADLGADRFDLILIGHVYHSMGADASADLARRCSRALRKGGLLAVAEFVADEDRRGPVIPLLFACNMLLGSETGSSFSALTIDGWARDAGLKVIEPVDIPTGSPIRLARK
ncbi:MAG: 3-hydroxy-5-methyl-1-naphthoate 3-O-methyltransferase [Phycisphaerae bacterium]|nr:3-hydroxy-5-methyl-1-naphthoate 3-O-methyltransferase [Phycisphaerae bacterium]